jgi:hypothetical protein
VMQSATAIGSEGRRNIRRARTNRPDAAPGRAP